MPKCITSPPPPSPRRPADVWRRRTRPGWPGLPIQLLSPKQVPSRRPTHFHHMSSEVSRSFAWMPASEQMTIRNEGMSIAPWLISMLLASVLPLGMPDTKMRPRGGRFYRPPTAAPLSLKPDGHFQPLWWLKLAGPGGHWLSLDVPSTGTVCGAIGDATGTHGELWKLPLCYKRYILSDPRLHHPLCKRRVRRVGDQRMGCEMCSRCMNLFKMPESVALMRRAPNVSVGRSFSPHYCILYYIVRSTRIYYYVSLPVTDH